MHEKVKLKIWTLVRVKVDQVLQKQRNEARETEALCEFRETVVMPELRLARAAVEELRYE